MESRLTEPQHCLTIVSGNTQLNPAQGDLLIDGLAGLHAGDDARDRQPAELN
jgi:hypothetical protein